METPHTSSMHAFAKSLDRFGYYLNRWTEYACALLAGAMLLTVGFGVVERYILNLGHTWPEELARYIMIWMALMAVPVCAYRREHIGLDLIFSRLPDWLRPKLRFVLDLIGMGFFLLLLIYGVGMTQAGGSQYATIFGITMMIPFLSVPVTSALTVFQILVTMLREYYGVTPMFMQREEGDAICSQ